MVAHRHRAMPHPKPYIPTKTTSSANESPAQTVSVAAAGGWCHHIHVVKKIVIREHAEIAAPPAVVWDFTQDYSRRAQWDPAVVTATETTMAGRRCAVVTGKGRVRMVFQYKQTDRPNKTSVQLIEGPRWLGGGGSWRYERTATGTLFTQTNTLVLRTRWARLLAPLIGWMFRRSTRKAIRNAKRMIEAHAAR